LETLALALHANPGLRLSKLVRRSKTIPVSQCFG
jgi:hypothetical protein